MEGIGNPINEFDCTLLYLFIYCIVFFLNAGMCFLSVKCFRFKMGSIMLHGQKSITEPGHLYVLPVIRCQVNTNSFMIKL